MAVREGDVVRVVLEGRASLGREACFRIDSDKQGVTNVIFPESSHVKSVEVIKPAKPKVGDVIHSRRDLKHLPSGSVVTNNYNDTLLIQPTGTTGLLYGETFFYPFDNGDENSPYTVRYIPE